MLRNVLQYFQDGAFRFGILQTRHVAPRHNALGIFVKKVMLPHCERKMHLHPFGQTEQALGGKAGIGAMGKIVLVAMPSQRGPATDMETARQGRQGKEQSRFISGAQKPAVPEPEKPPRSHVKIGPLTCPGPARIQPRPAAWRSRQRLALRRRNTAIAAAPEARCPAYHPWPVTVRRSHSRARRQQVGRPKCYTALGLGLASLVTGTRHHGSAG